MTERSYIISHESYWHNVRMNQNPTIIITTDSGEMVIEWHELGRGISAPQIQMFSDSWVLLETEKEFFDKLRDLPFQHIEDVSLLLDELGFEDKTKRENPNTDKSEVATLRNRISELEQENRELRAKIRMEKR